MTLNQALISEVTLNTASTTVTIPVPSGYTDLRLVASTRMDTSTSWYDFVVGFNGVYTNQSGKGLYGTGTGVGAINEAGGGTSYAITGRTNAPGNTANTFGTCEIYVPNYSSSSYKSVSLDYTGENNGAAAIMGIGVGTWQSTAAITSISLQGLSGSNFVAGSSFTLYGISKLGVTPTVYPKATGGDIIRNDGTYWYHAFTSTGVFIPQQSLSADVLVIAGGGGGGCDIGGAGGAGGLLGFTTQSLTATSYACTVGAGGAGGTSAGIRGTNGVNSQFAALTASIGGGGGGSYNSGNNGFSGGSGGGGGHDSTSGGAGTSGQGFAGGRGNSAGSSGGGGGATAVGTDAGSSFAGNGGAGSNVYSSWASATGTGVSGYYAGGGGGAKYNGSTGGTGGAGGGGNGGVYGGSPQNGTSGTVNTGSGAGGGSPYSGQGGRGGSGIVIIRYAMA